MPFFLPLHFSLFVPPAIFSCSDFDKVLLRWISLPVFCNRYCLFELVAFAMLCLLLSFVPFSIIVLYYYSLVFALTLLGRGVFRAWCRSEALVANTEGKLVCGGVGSRA